MASIRIGSVEIVTDGEFQGLAAASIAMCQEAAQYELGPGDKLMLASVFAQLEVANRVELLRDQMTKDALRFRL